MPTTCNASHGLNTSTGYVVRRTFFGVWANEDVATFEGATSYGQALELAREVRAEVREEGHEGHAVIDTLYACGCRGNG
jgi:hypothetical protein